jgi:enoyl-CoA hydratase/carnithine racemase
MTVNETVAEPLLLDRDGPVATLTINRPDRLNALTYAMFSRLPGLLAEAAALDGVRVLVLRGAGRRSFSAGADITQFGTARTTPEQAAAYDDAVLAAEEALATFPAPTIAAIHGHCYGGDDDAHAALREAALAAPDYAEGVRAFLERRPPRFG